LQISPYGSLIEDVDCILDKPPQNSFGGWIQVQMSK
jgi:hypothetical protein